ncbi:MAG: NAD(P)/FAD-dependent oxidoreductase [Ruthenibacterium sp.]
MAEIVIIGAGAAGLFAAGSAVAQGHHVTVTEHMDSAGKKLLITGKGRCNVTNHCTQDEFLKNVRRNPRFLFSALSACPPAFVMDLFENTLGVPLKTERGRRVFPQSDKAQDILSALLRYAQGAALRTGTGAKALCIQDGAVTGVMLQDGKTLAADAVLVATGGVSYPVTGSTGDGYRLAKQAGHTIVPPEPSLVSLVEDGGLCRQMMGLSLRNVALTLWEGEKAVYQEQGEMLFTHFGVSGPLVLSASAHIRDMKKYRYRITIDCKPALTAETLQKRVNEDFLLLSDKNAANSLVKLLPASMQPVMVQQWGVPPDKKVNQVTREERAALVRLLKAFPIALKDKGDLAHAVITSGGVNVKEIDPKTMQSKLCGGLYFAGEVLDVDAYTGGYNLGIAFATAHAAATHIASKAAE